MDFDKFQEILDKYGLEDDPAIKDPKFLVRIGQLPAEYRETALGIHYDEVPHRPDARGELWVPPEANEETVLHEIGHQVGYYYYGDHSEPFAEAFRTNIKNVGRRGMMTAATQAQPAPSPALRPARQAMPLAGQFTQINSVDVSPAVANPGDTISVNVAVQNIYSTGIHLYVVAVTDKQVRVINWQDASLDPGASQSFTGSFAMPAYPVVLNVYVYYDALDPETSQIAQVSDSESYTTSVAVTGGYQIPSDFTLQQYTVYPAAGSYTDNFEMCTFQFTAPLTFIPGVGALISAMLGAYVSACVQNGATPLELRIYTQPAQFGATNYIVQALAYGNQPAQRGVAADISLNWELILGALLTITAAIFASPLVAIVVGGGFLVLAINQLVYGGIKTTTTTTQPQTIPLAANQSLAISSGSATITAGVGGATIIDSKGNSTKLTSGQVATAPAGSTVVAGSGGATAVTAAQTTTTTGPSNPEGLSQTSDIVKYVIIGVGVVAVSLLAIGAMQAFGKRPVYAGARA